MSANDNILVSVKGVDRVFQRGSEEIHVLSNLDMEVRNGEFLALMGPSGSGKSTLLNLIGGLDRPTKGAVTIGGDSISSLSDRQLAAWRSRHIGFVFQLYNLLPTLTAEKNVELPLLLTPLTKAERARHVQAALEVVGAGFCCFSTFHPAFDNPGGLGHFQLTRRQSGFTGVLGDMFDGIAI